MANRIFISYKRVDKDKVFKLKNQIEAAIGEECWIDLNGIESDAMFKEVIIKAINECEVFLFMYSKSHSDITDFKKDWTIKELTFASAKNKRIVFVNIDGSELSDIFLFDYGIMQQIDGRSPEALNRLYSDIKEWLNITNASSNSTPQSSSSQQPTNPKNIPTTEEGQRWYRQACQGDAVAQFNLGECYEKGQGVTQDYSEAVKWYRKAAEQGYAAAQYNLGYCYVKGQGVTQDYSEAVKWYRKAAEQGHSDARKKLDALRNPIKIFFKSIFS